MNAFCGDFDPLVLISIAELWLGKEKRDRFSPNSIIKGIVEMIVFYSRSLYRMERQLPHRKLQSHPIGGS